ncbi:ribosome biogenesis GTP-binding protein YihA/YsxC [Helicobacter sp. 11S03491-1]|uniref:ribosome biogenesis GTP-binding protein YihA/YsxC n=1 Tax=Helicobacter sp. 11S03491-1 TaxID=1476196 RepID=UPI000BA516DD|nr:ribosome biogenesis GTP-binding protein YihA/YsxC [Helicobacter sp. 11S03491-1]PAF41990.1 hypothetical protein BKH45_05250 [Helicobacter sp. 11S03491-1]
MIFIKEANFLTSASKLTECPPPNITEVVFLGRSNVGKSTFINTLLDKKLAKSSTTPGKTQLINFFNTIWEKKEDQTLQTTQTIPLRFVDLPGFGYAKVSKQIKKDWERNLWEFLNYRTNIKLFIHLIDARHTQLELDSYVCKALNDILKGDQEILSIYTKFDKLSKNEQHQFYQKAKVVTSNNDKIIDKRYGGKGKIREMIFKGALGIDTN